MDIFRIINMFSSRERLIKFHISVLILGGWLLTGWGLIGLSWLQDFPWVDKESLVHFISFIVVSSGGIVFGAFRTKRSVVSVGVTIAFVLALAVGVLWPLLVVCWIMLAFVILGGGISRVLKVEAANENWLIYLLLGSGLYGTVVGLMAHFPVNYSGVYSVLLILPLLIWRRNTRRFAQLLFNEMNRSTSHDWLDIAIVVMALVYFIVALMPEVGYDALAMHLFIPSHMASTHQWGFEPGTYVWAVMPMLGDWIFSVAYVLAGETAARLMNVGFIFIIALLVRDLVLWAAGTEKGSKWAVLIFLTTPLTFTEGSSLFIESIWAAFVISGTMILFQEDLSGQEKSKSILLAGMMIGFSVATKAITLTILPILLLVIFWKYKPRLIRINIAYFFIAGTFFLSISSIPYITAWYLTGNPVFPFFNGIFQSSYYPPVNFESASTFGKGLTWDVLYRVTFDSGKYLEATPGAAGFQWLLLFLPTTILLLFKRNKQGLLLLLVGIMIVAAVFQSVSYLRYVFPAWAILAAAMGVALFEGEDKVKRSDVFWSAAASGTIILNVMFLNAGAFYRDFPIKSILSSDQRETYLQGRLPIRNAVDMVNQINTGRTPVAVFSHPLSAGLEADALYPNWYNFRFQGEINAADTVEELTNTLLTRRVDYVILDSAWSGEPEKRGLIEKSTDVITEYGSISVRRVKGDYRFQTELLKNPGFESSDGWSFSPMVEYDQVKKVVLVSVTSPATQAISVSPGQLYRNSVIARCYKEPNVGRVQINWLDSKGQFVSSDIKTFDCTLNWSEHAFDVSAPKNATVANVYATGHTATPIQFKRISMMQ